MHARVVGVQRLTPATVRLTSSGDVAPCAMPDATDVRLVCDGAIHQPGLSSLDTST